MQTETAEHFAKKVWNEKKQKFDYIYPSDLEKEKTRLAVKTMKSSKDNEIPTALKLSGPIESTMSTKERQEIKPKKMESQQGPLFVSNLSDKAKKTFEKATADCAPIRTLEMGIKTEPNRGDRMVNLSGVLPRAETQDMELAEGPNSDPTRSWKWKEHSYASRTGTKGHYKYNYGNAKQNDESLEVERKMQSDKQQKFVPGEKDKKLQPGQLPQREANPSMVAERSPQEKANIAKAPGQKLPPQGNPMNAMNPSPSDMGAIPKPMQIGGQMPNAKQNAQAFTNKQAPPGPTGVNPGESRNGATPAGQNVGNMRASESPFQNPLGQFMSNTPAPGNTMADQAKNMGHVFDSRQVGNEDYGKQDDPIQNPLHPSKIQQDSAMASRYGDCHRMAKAQADRYGGVRYTTSGRAANFHSMTVNPDQTVFDYVLGINGMPLDQYLALVPYTFLPN